MGVFKFIVYVQARSTTRLTKNCLRDKFFVTLVQSILEADMKIFKKSWLRNTLANFYVYLSVKNKVKRVSFSPHMN